MLLRKKWRRECLCRALGFLSRCYQSPAETGSGAGLSRAALLQEVVIGRSGGSGDQEPGRGQVQLRQVLKDRSGRAQLRDWQKGRCPWRMTARGDRAGTGNRQRRVTGNVSRLGVEGSSCLRKDTRRKRKYLAPDPASQLTSQPNRAKYLIKFLEQRLARVSIPDAGAKNSW